MFVQGVIKDYFYNSLEFCGVVETIGYVAVLITFLEFSE